MAPSSSWVLDDLPTCTELIDGVVEQAVEVLRLVGEYHTVVE
jgi:hypothetical protein